MFNKDPKETKKNQSIMNSTITEIKNTLEKTNGRIIETKEKISEVEDRWWK